MIFYLQIFFPGIYKLGILLGNILKIRMGKGTWNRISQCHGKAVLMKFMNVLLMQGILRSNSKLFPYFIIRGPNYIRFSQMYPLYVTNVTPQKVRCLMHSDHVIKLDHSGEVYSDLSQKHIKLICHLCQNWSVLEIPQI